MTSVDKAGNHHLGQGVPGGGRFTGKVRPLASGELVASEHATTTTPSAADSIVAAFDRESTAAWEHIRRLRTPAVNAATAYAREKLPDIERIHLHEDFDEDTMEPFITVESLVTRHGEYLEDTDVEETINGILRSVADNRADLAELPSVYQVPGTSTFVLPVHSVEPGDQTPAEQAFYDAVERDVYDNDLAAAALRSAAARHYPGADELIFEMNDTDEGSTLTFASIRTNGENDDTGAGFDDIDNLVFTMSGGGNTGDQITDMQKAVGEYYVFGLRGTGA